MVLHCEIQPPKQTQGKSPRLILGTSPPYQATYFKICLTRVFPLAKNLVMLPDALQKPKALSSPTLLQMQGCYPAPTVE